jgi:hypothetical protein
MNLRILEKIHELSRVNAASRVKSGKEVPIKVQNNGIKIGKQQGHITKYVTGVQHRTTCIRESRSKY